MNNTSNSTQVSDTTVPGTQTLGGFGYTIGLCLAILVVFVITTYASYMCKRVSGARTTLNRPRGAIDAATTDDDGSSIVTIHQDGLDEVTISSYPEFTYSQLDPHKSHSTASGCSVCLADYKQNDSIRLLPDCGHMFHVKCIDPWLMLHATCPICRSSPLPTPLRPVSQIHTH